MADTEPFFFGSDGPARFGVYHAPRTGSADRAIVLCYPLGHEYVRAHRAYRNLALAVSRAGRPVLRFDYVGSGDSGGEGADMSLPQWNRDVDEAVDEAKRRAGVTRVSLVGLRFGAALAALAAGRRDDVASVLLWDPVLRGRIYLDELRALQSGWLRDRLGQAGARMAGESELIGMPVHAALADELARVDVAAIESFGHATIDMVVSTPRPDCDAWLAVLRSRGIAASCAHVPSAGDWLNPEAVHQLLLPHEILRELTARLSR